MQTRIVKVTQDTAVGEGGKIDQVIRIDFMVGLKHGPFTVTLPRADFDAGKANAMIQAFANNLGLLQGIGE